MTLPEPQVFESFLRGRCLEIASDHLVLRNQAGTRKVPLDPSERPAARIGDIVEVKAGTVRVLTPNRTSRQSSPWMERVLSPRRLRAMSVRSQVEGGIRDFFSSRNFLETRTPTLVPCPGMEPHIRPFAARSWDTAPGRDRPLFLPTSPEFAMKRLLVGGLERIFQICTAFRDEPVSTTHHPEFTILEWYRAYAGYEDIMKDTEELFAHLATRITGKSSLKFEGKEISVAPPWPRLRVRDLFLEIAGIDLVKCPGAPDLARECRKHGLTADLSRESWDDLYFKIWLNKIEPRLPADRAVFVTRYPASQAALAVVDEDADGSRWARRFEAYAGGLELANAFEELTDPGEQRSRFEWDMKYRTEVYGEEFPPNPLDEEFLEALSEGMPPSGGIALGVDRLVMLFADEPDLDYTLWLKSRGCSGQ